MDHNGVVPVQVLLPPYGLKQPLGRDDLSPVLTQHPQDIELDGGKGQFLVIEPALVSASVDDQPVEVDDVAFRLVRPIVAGVPPELGLDPGHQLQGIEGLGDIVVCADGQSHDLVHVPHLGGEHEHRKAVLPADLPAQGEARHVRQHYVQNGQVQPVVPHTGQGLRRRAAGKDGKALAFQIDLHQIGNLRLVVHDQNVGVHMRSPFPPGLYPDGKGEVKQPGKR